VHELGLATDKGFVNFHSAGHRAKARRLHRQSDSVEHEPCDF
jgi:hypothetical protein